MAKISVTINELDDIDRKILQTLQKEARISHQELSERVGLSPSPCARRMKNLEQEGFILGYAARISDYKLGYDFTVFVSVRLDQQIDDRLVKFEQAVKICPEVVDCWLMTGSFDYLLRVAVRDLNEFESFLTGRLTKIPGVASIESSISIRQVKDTPNRLW